MCKFAQFFIHPFYYHELLHYIPHAQNCYKKYRQYLQDDFCPDSLLSIIKSTAPYFWLILTQENEFMGFVFLDNFVGTKNKIYSAEITTCYEQKAWGAFTRYSAKLFLKKCFIFYIVCAYKEEK